MDGSSSRVDKRSASENSGIALLSCELCTKRKIRCDKRQPCSACMKAGKECTPVLRARFPRGRRGGRKEATTELRDRVKRLESLVLSLSGNDSKPISQETSTPSSIENTNARADLPSDIHPVISQEDFMPGHSISTPSTDISRLLGSTVWAQLSDEVRFFFCVLLITSSPHLDLVPAELLYTMISTLPKPWCMGKESELSQPPQVVQTVIYDSS